MITCGYLHLVRRRGTVRSTPPKNPAIRREAKVVPIYRMLRPSHGKARASGRVLVVEGTPVDELPAGTVAPPLPRPEPGHRARLLAGKPTAEDQRRAGMARAEQRRAVRSLERLGLPPGSGGALAPFLKEAERWAIAECQRLAKHVGGGQCPPNVAALIRSAALAMAGAAERYAAGDALTGARLTAEQRANTLAAHELAAREAKARGARGNSSDAELAALLGLEVAK